MNLHATEASLKETLEKFGKLVPSEVSVFENGKLVPKTPYLLGCFQAMISSRILDLAEAATECYDGNRFVPAAILIRAVMESAALAHYVQELVRKQCDASDLKASHEALGRAMIGSKFDWKKHKHLIGDVEIKNKINAYQILDAIDSVVKIRKDFRLHYDALSEYAHPNHEGTWASYGSRETTKMKMDPARFPIESRSYILQSLEQAILVSIAAFGALGVLYCDLIFLSLADLKKIEDAKHGQRLGADQP